MPQTAQVQFMNRARQALEQGNTSFVARGKNKELYEEMKRTFEQEKNAQSASKRVKLSAVSPAPATESNSSDSSSDSSSQQSSYSDEEEETIVPTVESCHPLPESPSSDEKSIVPTVESPEQRQAAMAWQAEMQKRQEEYEAYCKSRDANRVHCPPDCEPEKNYTSGYWKDPMFDWHLAQTYTVHVKVMGRYEEEAREPALLLEVAE